MVIYIDKMCTYVIYNVYSYTMCIYNAHVMYIIYTYVFYI